MEEIYVNVEEVKHVSTKYSTNHTGPRSSEKSSYLGVTVFLGLLSVFLLAGLIVIGVHYGNSAAELSAVKDNLTEMTKQNTCPEGWTLFSGSCYFLSNNTGSWDRGRQDCRDTGADLVVIDSSEEQLFITNITSTYTWIGLNDREVEGTWKWVDGTPLTLQYWHRNQPNNGGGTYGEQDCAHTRFGTSIFWNDNSCTLSYYWICEKMP